MAGGERRGCDRRGEEGVWQEGRGGDVTGGERRGCGRRGEEGM